LVASLAKPLKGVDQEVSCNYTFWPVARSIN
jgi:hypothetical protein